MFTQLEKLRSHGGEVLQTILDQSQDCIKLISRTGHLEYMNRNGRRAMAIEDFDVVAQKEWSALWPEESRDLIDHAVARAQAGEKSRFEAYCPTLAGEPRWWDVSVSPILAEDGDIRYILSTSRDITTLKAERQSERERRERAEEHAALRDTVSREMRHRVKNLLAVVSAIAGLTSRQKPKTADFLPTFQSRLVGLGEAQHLLSENDDHRAELDALLLRLLGTGERDPRIIVGQMPKVWIDDQSAQVLALVVSELLTNAIKYGALNCEGGMVVVNVARDGSDAIVDWIERCDAPVQKDGVAGSGTLLMQRMTAGQAHPIRYSWNDYGFAARFSVRIAAEN